MFQRPSHRLLISVACVVSLGLLAFVFYRFVTSSRSAVPDAGHQRIEHFDAAETRFRLGKAAADAGNHDRALADYTEAIHLDPKRWPYYFFRGDSYGALKQCDNAIADYTEVIRLNPDFVGAYVRRSGAHGMKKEYNLAIVDCNRAIEIADRQGPGRAVERTLALNRRAETYAAARDFTRAIADYSELIRLNPQDADRYSNRGACYGFKGDFESGIADFSEAIRLNPKSSLFYKSRALAYFRKAEYDLAIADCTRAVQIDAGDAAPYHLRAAAHQVKQEFDKAIADYTDSIRLNPKAKDSFVGRAAAYRSLGKNKEAGNDERAVRQLENEVGR
ncbi:MAG TPA: tetratricopeptide repeat protein [Gemmataceae bacterium]|jgi:tetratricopeptide (TPR) repeat protein|nr:tetratricopeptide repeat protein [Gemmataceae bacterium]